jgi:hypothetical protein
MMRTKLFLVLTLLAVLFSAFASPRPVAASNITGITLVETVYLREKGVTFKFRVSGEFTEREMKGTFTVVGGKTGKLRCNYNDGAGLVVCTAPPATAQSAGSTGIATLAGYSFYIIIPARTNPR